MRVNAGIKLEVGSATTTFKSEDADDTKENISCMGKRRVKLEAAGGSPFPDFKRPSYEDCRQVVDSLSVLHGIKEVQNSVRPVLDALIRTILSQNTTDKTSMIAFQNLKRVCPTWKSCLASHDSVIEEAIRFGGLAEIKV